MGSKLGVQARAELLATVGEFYRDGTSGDKRRILDAFVLATGYHRKHSIRLLRLVGTSGKATIRRPRLRLYDEAVREALTVLWEASDRVCGKRLKALLPVLVPSLESHGHLQLDQRIRDRVLLISASSIDRLLSKPRASAQAEMRARIRAKPAVRRIVKVRTFADWKDPLPGFMEADLVAHGGETMAGSFAHTLVLTDISSGWTECVVLAVREGTLIVEALEQLRTNMPFPLLGFDTDNGSEFMNEAVLAYCQMHNIEFTRSRPYRKNDQAWVEQKNGAIVRRMVGYGRLEGLAAAETLQRLYSASRLFVNFFQPSFKLAEKTRHGARVHKRYHPPATPAARLLASDAISTPMKERLHGLIASLDPLRLLEEIRTVQQHLADLVSGLATNVIPGRSSDLDAFLRSLSTAWQGGEVRPTHQPKPKPQRHWRTRADPFEDVWPRVRAWLDQEPDRTAKELLERLQDEYAGQFSDGLLRTLQRRVKQWRADSARRLVFSGTQFGRAVDCNPLA